MLKVWLSLAYCKAIASKMNTQHACVKGRLCITPGMRGHYAALTSMSASAAQQIATAVQAASTRQGVSNAYASMVLQVWLVGCFCPPWNVVKAHPPIAERAQHYQVCIVILLLSDLG